MGVHIAAWTQALVQKWASLQFGDVNVTSDAKQHVFDIELDLNDLDPNEVCVELYANPFNGGGAAIEEMKRTRPGAELSGGYHYRLPVAAIRPSTDYTVRVIPRFAGVAVPLEEAQILWQR